MHGSSHCHPFSRLCLGTAVYRLPKGACSRALWHLANLLAPPHPCLSLGPPVYEDCKMSVLNWRLLVPLGGLLAELAEVAGAAAYVDHYARDLGTPRPPAPAASGSDGIAAAQQQPLGGFRDVRRVTAAEGRWMRNAICRPASCLAIQQFRAWQASHVISIYAAPSLCSLCERAAPRHVQSTSGKQARGRGIAQGGSSLSAGRKCYGHGERISSSEPIHG